MGGVINNMNKKLFIPTDHNGNILGVFASYVDAFLLGRNEMAHAIEEIDIHDEFTYSLPLVTLITSYKKRGYDIKDSEEIRIMKRGN